MQLHRQRTPKGLILVPVGKKSNGDLLLISYGKINKNLTDPHHIQSASLIQVFSLWLPRAYGICQGLPHKYKRLE